MIPLKAIALAGWVFIILVGSIHGGYMIGSTAENETELENEIESVQSDFSKTIEENLTANYSEGKSDNKLVEPIQRMYFEYVIKPVYWLAAGTLEFSAVLIEATARFTYENL